MRATEHDRQHDDDLKRLGLSEIDQQAEELDAPKLRHAPLDPQENDAPKFVVQPILPRRVVTLLGAHGGAGKTMLSLTIAAHCAAGVNWAGFRMEGASRVLFATLEDEPGLIRSRLQRIVHYYGLDREHVWRNLRLMDGTELEMGLAYEGSIGGAKGLHATSALTDLEAEASGFDLLIVDNASDAFNANENERMLVRMFMRGMLGRIARRNDCALVLLAHVDKQAAKFGAQGNSYSGSTAWHNSARSRLALVERDGVLELIHEKCNLARRADPVQLEFAEGGVLVPIKPREASVLSVGGQIIAGLRPDPVAEDLFDCLRAAIEAGETIPTGESGPASAFVVCRELPNFPRAIRKGATFYSTLRRLEREGRIAREGYRTPARKTKERWSIPCPAPVAPVAPVDATSATGTRD